MRLRRLGFAHLLLAATLLINACGFHLRGNAVPLDEENKNVYLQAPDTLADELALHLRDSGALIVSEREQADLVLTTDDESFNRRVLSVDAETGKVREYELSYAVGFNLKRGDGAELVEPQTISLQRDFLFADDEVISASRETNVIRDEMRRDAVQRILWRMRAALENE